MIVRGTTPTHTFTLPVDCGAFTEVRVLYSQNDDLVIKKETEDVTCEGNRISCTLTQKDTLALDDRQDCEIQVRALSEGGTAVASKIMRVPVGKCLDDEVLA